MRLTRSQKIATIDLAMQDSKIIDDYFAASPTKHVDMLLTLCEQAWSHPDDYSRTVLDEDEDDWGCDIPDDFPTGW